MTKNLLSVLMAAGLVIMSGYARGDVASNNSFSASFFRDNFNGSRTLLGHVPHAVSQSIKTSHLNAGQTLELRITLPIKNEAQLDTLLQGLYDPKNSNYRHFLTPDQFTQQFGASDIETQQVKAFLKAQGLTVTGQSSNGLVLNVSGNTASVENAFGVRINNYQKKDGSAFFAPEAEPTVPVEMVGKINAIGGLDNVIKFSSHAHPVAQQAQSSSLMQGLLMTKPLANAPKQIGTGPGGYVAPKDVYNAYNLNSVPANGNGQSVALFELDGYLQKDITGYESAFNIPNVPLQNVLIDGFNGNPTPSGGSAEVTLDIQLVAAVAPGLSKILVYEAPNTWQAWVDEWTRLANDKDQYGNLLVHVVSCSWGLAESYSPEMSFDNAIFKQMAAQGQAVFVASGDSGAYDDGSTLSVDEPAAQPYVTAVGISKLAVNSDGSYNSETASSQSGGGISKFQAIPAYQAGMVSKASLGSTTKRNLPDVSLTADPGTCYAFYINGSWNGYWGSSLAAPIWASFISRVNQGRVSAGQSLLGFANPQLYQIAQSSSYAADFHDVVGGSNQYYPAVAGYDLATGLGSFNGANLYKGLTGTTNSLLPTAPAVVSATVSSGKVQLSWSASSGAATYNVKRSLVSGGPFTTIASGITATSYTDATTQANTLYYYVVSGVNTAGEGANSLQIGGLMSSVPTAPSGLTATALQAQVSLSWNSAMGATYYNVKRSTVSGGPFTNIATTTSTAYTDSSSLSGGTTYYYAVSAVDSVGESANSASAKVTITFAAPKAPASIQAMPGNNQVTVSWSASTGAVTYNVKRATVSLGATTLVGSGITGLSFTDTTAKNGVTYFYVVSAVNGGGESPNSNQFMTTPFAPATAPTGLAAVSGKANIPLTWNPVSGAYWYYVSRATVSGGPYNYIGYSMTNNYTDTSVTGGVTYYYVVSTYIYVNGVGNVSPNSAPVSATPLTRPSAPTGISAMPGNNQVALTWNASSGAVSYNVKRSTVSGSAYTVLSSGVTANKYTDTTAKNGTVYFYVVSAVNAAGESANSNQFMTVPFAPAVAATGLSSVSGKGSVALAWNAVSVPSTESVIYYIGRSTVSKGPFVTIGYASTNKYTDTAVVKGVVYYYVVSTYINAAGAGNMSPSSAAVAGMPTQQ